MVSRHIDTALYMIPQPSLNVSTIWFKYFQVMTATMEVLIAGLIMIMRLWAVYSRNKPLLAGLMVLWACCGASSIAVLAAQSRDAIGTNSPTTGVYFCIVTSKLSFLWAYWIPFIVFETVVFALAALKTWSYYRVSRRQLSVYRQLSLLEIMFHDSTAYFLILLAVCITNAAIYRFGKPGMYNITQGPTTVIISITMSRMIFHLRQVAYNESAGTEVAEELSTFRTRIPSGRRHYETTIASHSVSLGY
ncbi:hypothetical protein BXZ70DRAFT_553460 [Cristinia sonorae]|uniref:Uncharacterized protein n=1 Tax=Cristinia sonorae TaxID=1940300 RepID=A0A8K0XL11_9AGAR|nr:hypothetical protein BXZ70DRAFT_553460 [Cristinia sonorae]